MPGALGAGAALELTAANVNPIYIHWNAHGCNAGEISIGEIDTLEELTDRSHIDAEIIRTHDSATLSWVLFKAEQPKECMYPKCPLPLVQGG